MPFRSFKRRRGTLKRKRFSRRKRVFRKRIFRRRRGGARKNVSTFRRTGDYGTRARTIKTIAQRKTFVRRSYESSASALVQNTNTIDWAGAGFSISGTYDTTTYTVPTLALEVYYGGLKGTGTASGIGFENVAEEWASMSQVFRYFRISKFQARIDGLPQAVYQPTIPDPQGNAQQGFTWGSMGDPGVMLLRSWGGGPGIVNYSNGQLVANDYSDHARYKQKKQMRASTGKSPKQLIYTVTPMRPIADGVERADAGTTIIRYEKAPAVDVNDFASGHTGDCGGFGQILFWYFPSCALAATSLLTTHITFSVEIEYWGLRNTPGLTEVPPLLANQVEAGSKDQLMAMLKGHEVEAVDVKHAKQKKQVKIPGPVVKSTVEKDAVFME